MSSLDYWRNEWKKVTETDEVTKTNQITDTDDLLGIKDEELENSNSVLFFVNGHFSKLLPGPSKSDKEYWNYFDKTIEANARKHYKISVEDDVKYVDASSELGFDSSGQERKNKGYEYGTNYSNNNKAYLKNKDIYFISHSEGCAFATGMAKSLEDQNLKVIELIMLACDEGYEFEIDLISNTFQIG